MPVIPRWLWDAWLGYVGVGLAIGAVWFGVMEGIALANRVAGDTLSELVWADHLPAILFFAAAGLVIASEIWLLIHFISGGKWGI